MLDRGKLGLTVSRLRWWLAGLFLLLAIPTVALIWHSYAQLKWEAFHQSRVQARELTKRIDSQLVALMQAEQGHGVEDYQFTRTGSQRRSVLSDLPDGTRFPGLISYFQVDANGRFSTPLLPSLQPGSQSTDLSVEQLQRRRELQQTARTILVNNSLVPSSPAVFGADREQAQPAVESVSSASVDQSRSRAAGASKKQRWDADSLKADTASVASGASKTAPAPSERQAASPIPSQRAFDRLGRDTDAGARKRANQLGSVAELELAKPFPSRVRTEEKRERQSLGEAGSNPTDAKLQVPAAEPAVTAFKSEVDPFVFRRLDSGHFVMFRNVWRADQRTIQGALIDQRRFFAGAVEPSFRNTVLAGFSSLALAHQGEVLEAVSGQATDRYLTRARELSGSLLYQSRLSAPLSDLELVYSVTRLPAAPGAWVLGWTGAILGLLLPGIFYMLYRLGKRQIELARQQQDFVSAVSHELRTPLTSIRMYGELLKAGWATEEKKQLYYEFIHDESERLSRLISNVLQLARMNREELEPDLKPRTLAQLNDEVISKVSSQIERADFQLAIADVPESELGVLVDPDFFSQIAINLIDNALKFSADSDVRKLEIGWQIQGKKASFVVRDHGPGIERDQMKKVFGLFYRTGNELTRKTVGTGIGLALVDQLARAMGADVEVSNAQPGARFRVNLSMIKICVGNE